MPDQQQPQAGDFDGDIRGEADGWSYLAPPTEPRQFEQVRAALRLVRSRMDGRRVFFYPAAGKLSEKPSVDLEPLTRFSHVCKAFLFVVKSAPGSFEGSPQALVDALQPEGDGLRLRVGQVHTPFSPADLGYGLTKLWQYSTNGDEPALADYPRLWHLVADRRIANIERELDLIVFDLATTRGVLVHAPLVYNRLFNFAGTAPHVLCIKNGLYENAGLLDWDGELGRVIGRGSHYPEVVVGDVAPGEYGFPWNELWQVHHGWGTARSYLRDPAPPGHGHGGQEVHFQGVLPGEGSYDDWELSWGAFTQRRANRTVRITRDKPECELLTLEPRWGVRSLLETLRHLERKLLKTDTSSACVHLVGFEDQGPDLAAWRMSSEARFDLTVWVDSRGAWESFAPFGSNHDFPNP